MSYLPIARKYRPQAFDDLVGQPHVTTTLTRAIESKRLGQAHLFTGQRGVGKTSAARILAKCLNCAKGPTPKPCQTCPSCTQITAGSSLDVIEIDGASNRGIDEIRSLRESVKFAPTHGAFRVYILDEVHQITHDGFNALLKTLEEPPAHVKFIFATTAPQKVPPTILSRCQRFDFRRLEAKTIVAALTPIVKAEKISIDARALYAIARASEGSLRDAEVILEQVASFCDGRIGEDSVSQLLGAVEQEALLAWAKAIIHREAAAALALLARQLNDGKDVSRLLVDLVTHLRNLLILRATQGAASREALVSQLIDLPDEERAPLEAQAQEATTEELLLMIQLLAGAYELSRRSPLAQTILEMVLIQLATRASWTSLDGAIQRLEQLSRAAAPRETPPGASKPPSTPPALARSSPAGTPSAPTPEPSKPLRAASTHEAVVSPERLSEQWPVVLERLGAKKMSLAAYLMEARPTGVEGACLQVGLPGFALHQEVLTTVENLRLVERVLEEVFGTHLTVAYGRLPDPPPQPAAVSSAASSDASMASSVTPAAQPSQALPPIVRDIVNLFDATIVRPPSSKSLGTA